MFNVGEAVIYCSQVYTVEGTEKKTIGKTVKEYYCLKNVYDERNSVFIPVDNELLVGKMRAVLSRKEILEMIAGFPNIESCWVEDEKERNAKFKEILEKHIWTHCGIILQDKNRYAQIVFYSHLITWDQALHPLQNLLQTSPSLTLLI